MNGLPVRVLKKQVWVWDLKKTQVTRAGLGFEIIYKLYIFKDHRFFKEPDFENLKLSEISPILALLVASALWYSTPCTFFFGK